MKQCALDKASTNVIGNAMMKRNIELKKVDNDIYIKSSKDLHRIESANVYQWIKHLQNIQKCDFRSCAHTSDDKTISCSGCKDDGIQISGSLVQSLLMRYMFEKMKLNEFKEKEDIFMNQLVRYLRSPGTTGLFTFMLDGEMYHTRMSEIFAGNWDFVDTPKGF